MSIQVFLRSYVMAKLAKLVMSFVNDKAPRTNSKMDSEVVALATDRQCDAIIISKGATKHHSRVKFT